MLYSRCASYISHDTVHDVVVFSGNYPKQPKIIISRLHMYSIKTVTGCRCGLLPSWVQFHSLKEIFCVLSKGNKKWELIAAYKMQFSFKLHKLWLTVQYDVLVDGRVIYNKLNAAFFP